MINGDSNRSLCKGKGGYECEKEKTAHCLSVALRRFAGNSRGPTARNEGRGPEREFYLKYFYNGVFLIDESVTGNETPKEAARITAKNQMIEECKAYIESLYGKAMPQEVFDAKRH